jgi:hypothetical protein
MSASRGGGLGLDLARMTRARGTLGKFEPGPLYFVHVLSVPKEILNNNQERGHLGDGGVLGLFKQDPNGRRGRAFDLLDG